MFELRGYQTDIAARACRILVERGLVYLAMQVRTGKTLTALEAARLYGAANVLFLTKLKAIASIQSDYALAGHKFNFTVTNYEQVHNIALPMYDFFILDEAHGLGAFPKPSLRATRLRPWLQKKPVIYLSGTPTPESGSMIFNQLWVSRNSPYDQYRNFYEWARSGYVKTYQVKRGAYMINQYDRADEERIRADLEPIMISYTQEQAGFQCEIVEHFHEVEDPVISSLIKRIFKDRILEFPEGRAIAETPAALMNKMHQLSSGTCICENGTAIISDCKARYIKSAFDGKRISIYYKFIGERAIIDKWFPAATESPEAFQRGESNTFVSQVLSGREGVALCSADALVFFAIDYSATSYWQARARIQDLNRTTPAEVHWIFVKGGIDKKVHKAVSEKKDFTYQWFKRNVAPTLF